MTNSIKKLQDLFTKFPTIGSRTASRFVFFLLRQPKEYIDELVLSIQGLKANVKLCSFCFNPYEGSDSVCQICQNPNRNRQLLCIVEKEADLEVIETAKRYKGLYFILGGVLNLRRNNEDFLRIKALKERLQSAEKYNIKQLQEIIIALNPTPEGKSTSMLVERAIKEIPASAVWKVTHLAQGLPVGGELEYADEETLESAFEGRK